MERYKRAMRGQKKVFFYDTLANMMSEDSFGISFQEPKLFQFVVLVSNAFSRSYCENILYLLKKLVKETCKRTVNLQGNCSAVLVVQWQ